MTKRSGGASLPQRYVPRKTPDEATRVRFEFCGRAHASRYVERWIAGVTLNLVSDAVPEPSLQKSTQLIISDEEDEATALELATRYR